MRKKARKKRTPTRICRKPNVSLLEASVNFRKFIHENYESPYKFHLASKICQTVIYQLYNASHYPKPVTLKRLVSKSQGKLTLEDLGVE